VEKVEEEKKSELKKQAIEKGRREWKRLSKW
jgi:hypothetical protein